MASATKYTNIYASYGAYYGLYVEFVENSTSVANNTSSITLSASISSQNSSGWSAGSNSTLTLYWHDNRENYDRYVSSISFSGVGVGETKTTSGTINATHNDDGTLSGYAYVYFAKGGSSAYAPASSGLTTDWTTLTTIARASQPSCITYPNTTSDVGDIGGTFTIHMNRKSTSFTHTVRYSWYNKSGTIATNVTDNCQWTIPNDFAEDIPSEKKSWGTIFADTYNGSTLIGTKSVVFWCNVADANPTFDASYLDTNSTTTAITGDNQQIIRNQSLLEIDVTNATAYKYATLSSIKATINGIEYTATLSGSTATFNIGTINVASDTNAVVTLTDSRGFTATQTLALEVLNWELPTAIIDLQRENNYYSNTNINVDANYSSLDSHNAITLKTRYKKVTDSSYGSYVTLQDNVTSTLNLDNNYQWDVQVLVQDLLGQTTYNLTLDRGIPIVYFDRLKRSVGVNCFPQLDTSIELNGHPIGGVITGSIQMYAGSTAPSGWLICDGSAVSRTTYADLFSVIGTTYGTGDGSTTFNIPNLKGKVPVGLDSSDTSFDTIGETGGEKTHTLTYDEMPSHSHGVIVGYTGSGSAHFYYSNNSGDGYLQTQNAGNGQAHNNLQPYIVLNYIIAC